MATIDAGVNDQPGQSRAEPRSRRKAFFIGMAILMLAVVALGFGKSFFLRPYFTSTPLPGYLMVHGLTMTAWFLLFLAQSSLVSARRIDLHRQLGIAGLVLAAGVVATAIVVNLNVAPRMLEKGLIPQLKDGVPFALASLSALPAFVILVGLAVGMRRRPNVHKRLMFWASVWMLGPAFTNTRPLGAALDPLVAPYLPFFPADLFWLIALVAYDVVTLRRVHAATYITFILLFLYFMFVTPWIAGNEALQGWLLAIVQGSPVGR